MKNDDLLDQELKNVMGPGRCEDVTKEPKKEVKKEPKKETPVDASWMPVREESWLDNLKACVKSAGPIGALSCVVFWWQQAGLLEATTAFWTLIILGFLAGLSLGRYVVR